MSIEPAEPNKAHAEELFNAIGNSVLLREYEKAFTRATGLPVVLRPVEAWRVPFHGRPGENKFCALMSETSRTCALCLQVQEKLSLFACRSPHTQTCYWGLYETAVPVAVADEVIGYLQTGQIFFRKPIRRQFERMAARAESYGLMGIHDRLSEAYGATRAVPRRWYESVINLLGIFAQHLSMVGNQLNIVLANKEPVFIARAKAYMEAHPTESLSLREVAKVANVSPFYFCKAFKRRIGANFGEYRARMRIEKSKELLFNPNMTITEIAFAVGFQSLTHFNRTFKKLLDKSPSAYRSRLLKYLVRANEISSSADRG